MSQRNAAFRPRPIDVHVPLPIVRDLNDLSEEGVATRAAQHGQADSHEVRQNEEWASPAGANLRLTRPRGIGPFIWRGFQALPGPAAARARRRARIENPTCAPGKSWAQSCHLKVFGLEPRDLRARLWLPGDLLIECLAVPRGFRPLEPPTQAGKAKDTFIPTPAVFTVTTYEQDYRPTFKVPTTYIRGALHPPSVPLAGLD